MCDWMSTDGEDVVSELALVRVNPCGHGNRCSRKIVPAQRVNWSMPRKGNMDMLRHRGDHKYLNCIIAVGGITCNQVSRVFFLHNARPESNALRETPMLGTWTNVTPSQTCH